MSTKPDTPLGKRNSRVDVIQVRPATHENTRVTPPFSSEAPERADSRLKLTRDASWGGEEEQGGCGEDCSCGESAKPAWKFVLTVLACLLCGVVFGWSLQKGRVFEPKNIRGQMLLRRWVMMKMFLSASSAGTFVFVILSVIPKTKDLFSNIVTSFTNCFVHKGALSTILGSFLLGSGMTMSGACPGMVLAQIGTWAENCIFTFLGALTGALVYGMLAPYIVKITMPKAPYKNQTLWQAAKVPYIAFALPLAVLLAVVVFLLEYFVPWTSELDVQNEDTNIFSLRAWPPGVAGALIGLLQLPLVFLVHDSLGSSSSFVTVVSQPFVGRCAKKHFPYLHGFRCGLANWWQVFYIGGAMLGACIAAAASDTLDTQTPGPSAHWGFIGGFVMLFGSRLGAGCTSGHGLSGMGLVASLSFIAVPVMFVGGISTAFIMWGVVNLDTDTFYSL